MSVLTRRNVIIAGAAIAVALVAVAWWLVSPLFFDKTVTEEFPMSAGAVVPEDMTQQQAEEEMEQAAGAADVSSEEPMPEMSQLRVPIATGSFRDADDFHMGSGTATLYDLGPEGRFLRLENLSVTNGPDLHVLLVPHGDPMTRDDVTGYIDLGSLKGNLGDQNYQIPPGIDPGDFGSVVIYCQPFHVLFSVASLSSTPG